MGLNGKVAVITGAASGIGLATAKLLSAEGVRLVLGDLDRTAGERVVKEIGALGGQVDFAPTDVSSELEVQRLIGRAVEQYGKIDIVFNNAGVSFAKPVTESTEDDFDLLVSVNLKGVFFGCKHALPYLLENPAGGVIVNTSSNGGLIGRPGDPLYVATKHGVMGLTKSLALAYADQMIRVNAVCPGPIDTPIIWNNLDPNDDRDEYLRRAVASCPTPRMADPEEVARAALFLVSEDSSFVNGVGLAVDGAKAAGVFNSNRYSLDFDLMS